MFTRAQIHEGFGCIGCGVRGINRTTNPARMVLIHNANPYDYLDNEIDERIIEYVGTGSRKTGDQKMNGDNKVLEDFDGHMWVFKKLRPNEYKYIGIYKKVGEYKERVDDGRRVFVFTLEKVG
jgi:hypothetical protein